MSANKQYIYRGDSLEFLGKVEMRDVNGVLITNLTGWTVTCGLQHAPEFGGEPSTPAPSGYLPLTAVFTEYTPEPKVLISGTPVQTATLADDQYTFQIRYTSPSGQVYSENVLLFQVSDPSTQINIIPLPEFSPTDVFIGRTGTLLDFTKIENYYQDSAKLVPVTSFGQLVKVVEDTSGVGNDADQPTDLIRPAFSARKNWLVGTELLATQSFDTVGAAYIYSQSGSGTVVFSGAANGTLTGPGFIVLWCVWGTVTVTVTGVVTQAQFEIGCIRTNYQQVNTDSDYLQAGVIPHLYFNNTAVLSLHEDNIFTPNASVDKTIIQIKSDISTRGGAAELGLGEFIYHDYFDATSIAYEAIFLNSTRNEATLKNAQYTTLFQSNFDYSIITNQFDHYGSDNPILNPQEITALVTVINNGVISVRRNYEDIIPVGNSPIIGANRPAGFTNDIQIYAGYKNFGMFYVYLEVNAVLTEQEINNVLEYYEKEFGVLFQ